MLDLVQDFVDIARRAEHEEALSSHFHKSITELGFDRFCAWSLVGQLAVPDEAVKLVHYQEGWISYYKDMEYWKVDPTLPLGMESATPFLWTDLANDSALTKRQRDFMNEAAGAGLKFGLTVPVRGVSAPPGNVTVYGDVTDFDPISKHTIHLLSVYLYEAVCRLAQDRDARLGYALPEALTGRERECLKWAAMGKTDWEIGEILRISQATAHFHIEKSKRKFGVATRTQAVVQAVLTGQIVP